jgi:hypothetical protein
MLYRSLHAEQRLHSLKQQHQGKPKLTDGEAMFLELKDQT